MTESPGGEPQAIDLDAMFDMLETMGPEGLAALLPAWPDPSTYANDPLLASVTTRDVTISGPHGDVAARHYRLSSEGTGAAIVWVHGGGFMGGDLEMPEAHWVSLALAGRGLGVLSVDYRKCLGGVHHPVPSDDVLAAWRWATEHAGELGTNSEHLHLGGASAGGSLAAGVAKRLRDEGSTLPASLVLVYPTLHAVLPPMSDELAEATEAIRAAVPMALVERMQLNYVGTEELFDDPYAFPGLGDVSGLPAVYVLNSDTDILRASGEAFATALEAAGVEVTVEHEPGTAHGHLNDPALPAATRSIERITAWLEAH